MYFGNLPSQQEVKVYLNRVHRLVITLFLRRYKPVGDYVGILLNYISKIDLLNTKGISYKY